MKIIQLAAQWRGTIGGPTNYVGFLAQELRMSGQEVVVAAPQGTGADIGFPPACPARELFLLRALLALKPDIAHAHGSLRFLVPCLLAKLLSFGRLKVIFTFHTQPTFRSYLEHDAPISPCYSGGSGLLGSILLSCTDAVASVSQSIVDNINKHCGMRVGKVVVIPSGAVPAAAKVVVTPKNIGPVLASVGVFSWDWKIAGYFIIFEALALLKSEFPGITLIVAGDGSRRLLVEQKIAELGIGDNVVLKGYLSAEDTSAVVAEADAYVHGALLEGCSLAIVEAMMAGKPIVAVAAGGTPEILKDGETGLLAQPSAESVAKALRRLFLDKSEAKRLGNSARAFAENKLTWAHIAAQYLDLYTRVLARNISTKPVDKEPR
ncbi:MAG: glycosyltransferase family 4 protein [Elusimicrobia bacterium]|nr:glycosyltransferase family 4 protein [Elusimicrobiota bacterium]